MNPVKVLVIFILGLILQLTIADKVAIAGAKPDFLIVILVALALNRNVIAAVIIGFFLGFLQDLASPAFLGMNAFAKSLIAYGIARIGGEYLPHNILYFIALIFSAVLINDIISLNVVYSFSFTNVLGSFFRYSLLTAVYSALLGGVLYILVFGLGMIGVVRQRSRIE